MLVPSPDCEPLGSRRDILFICVSPAPSPVLGMCSTHVCGRGLNSHPIDDKRNMVFSTHVSHKQKNTSGKYRNNLAWRWLLLGKKIRFYFIKQSFTGRNISPVPTTGLEDQERAGFPNKWSHTQSSYNCCTTIASNLKMPREKRAKHREWAILKPRSHRGSLCQHTE